MSRQILKAEHNKGKTEVGMFSKKRQHRRVRVLMKTQTTCSTPCLIDAALTCPALIRPTLTLPVHSHSFSCLELLRRLQYAVKDTCAFEAVVFEVI